MNRISRPCSRANRASGTTSSSVEPLDRHGVDLHGIEPGLLRGQDPLDHLLEAGPPGQLLEAVRVHRIQADVDPPQPRVPERLRQRGQQDAVGRQADVLDARDRGDLRDQPRQVAADQRLAPGQPDLVDPQRHHDPHEPLDLLEAQELAPRQELRILRHAVDAADVAPIRHADPQVVVHPAKRVDERIGG